MKVIRKGAIVWNHNTSSFMKTVTSSTSGELTDSLSEMTGLLKHHSFIGIVLCEAPDCSTPYRYKNKCVYLTRAHHLFPKKEYLEIQKQLTIKSN